jgi:hypothetical protein
MLAKENCFRDLLECTASNLDLFPSQILYQEGTRRYSATLVPDTEAMTKAATQHCIEKSHKDQLEVK